MRRRIAAAIVAAAAALAGCVTTPEGGGGELGRSSHLVVAAVQPGDTAASLAARYLHDPALAWRVSPLSGALRPGTAAAVALTDRDADLSGPARYVPILCYHRFTAGRSTSRMEVAAAEFARQLQWLHDQGWTVVPLKQVLGFVAGRNGVPGKAVAITIDDGYRSAYEVAAPVLKRFNDPATLFVYTDFVGAGAGLSWAQVEEIRRGGLIDVQSHSKTHPDLAKRLPGEAEAAYEKRLHTEVDLPLQLLSRHGAADASVFAFPYGATNPQVEAVLKAAGYPAAVTVARGGNPGWAPPFLLRRDMIFGDDSLARFGERLETAARGGTGAGEAEGLQ